MYIVKPLMGKLYTGFGAWSAPLCRRYFNCRQHYSGVQGSPLAYVTKFTICIRCHIAKVMWPYHVGSVLSDTAGARKYLLSLGFIIFGETVRGKAKAAGW
jgi:hypothetical protein